MTNITTKLTSNFDHRKEWARNAELYQLRVSLFKKEDRLLPKLYFSKGLSFRELSQLSGLEERLVARRIRQITKSLLSDEYITIVRHKSQFSKIELEVAYDRYLLGLGYRKIAKRHDLGVRPTLRIIRKLDFWLRRKLQK